MSDLTDPPRPTEDFDDSSSYEDSDDQCWDDWVEDPAEAQPCRPLFGDQESPTVLAALEHDKSQGFDLRAECIRLGLDSYGRIRFINYIRKHKPSIKEISTFTPSEPFLASDEYLRPVLEDDPLLLQDDDWSDDSDSEAQAQDPAKKVKTLEKKLAQLQRDFADYKAFVSSKLDIARLAESLKTSDDGPDASQSTPRDDDTHYFQSYGEHDIHAVMIQDKVRTSTYASFILSNPELMQDAIVLDVGCGTGILSLFAARAGAKKVYAIDASDIVEKAEKIVKANGLDDVITVIRGKVENISLPDGVKADVIISEWMGYALLYESMLDSVLYARDKFLKPGGTMAPSQCHMMLALCDATEVYKDRIGFWDDVYGFDMSVMGENSYGEAIVDVVGDQTLLSEPVIVKDLHLNDITPKQLDFKSSFTLVSTVAKRTKVNSFVLYFDTFFTADGEPIPEGAQVQVVGEGDGRLVEVWQVGGAKRRSSIGPNRRRSSVGLSKHQEEKPKIASFSTGPRSMPTHWKQTLFLLQSPISVVDGSIVEGQFFCKKSEDNSRELNVELHFSVRDSPEAEPGQTVIYLYKVR